MSVPQPHPKLIPVEDLVKMVISNWSVTYLCSVNLKQCHDKIICLLKKIEINLRSHHQPLRVDT